MSHFAKKCNGFHFYTNIKKPELSLAMVSFFFLKRNEFMKARKQVVTTKLFINIHFCSLGMKTYRFQPVKLQVTLQEQLLSLKSL